MKKVVVGRVMSLALALTMVLGLFTVMPLAVQAGSPGAPTVFYAANVASGGTIHARHFPTNIAAVNNHPTEGVAFNSNTVINEGRYLRMEASPRTGYTFIGWRINGGNVSTGSNVLIHRVGANVTDLHTVLIEAVFQRDIDIPSIPTPIPMFNLIIDARPGAESPDISVRQQGSTVNLVAGARTGYTFVHWLVLSPSVSNIFGSSNTTISPNTSFTMPSAHVHIEAVWTRDVVPQNLTVANMPAGAPAPVGQLTISGTYTPGVLVPLVSGTREGFVFTGWTSPDMPGVNLSGANFTMPNNPVTLTANWVPAGTPLRDVRIYGIDGNTGAVIQRHPVGAQVQLNAGVRTGHAFDGWVHLSGTAVNFAPANSNQTTFIMPEGTGDIRIEATWRLLPANRNTVTLLNNPFWPGATANHPSIVVPSGASVDGVVTDAWVTLNPGSRANYQFDGWSFVPAVTIDPANSNRFQMPNAPVVATANWSLINPTFRPVNITNSGASLVPTSGQTTSGLTHAPDTQVSINAGEIPGYTFSHWVITSPTSIPGFNINSASQTFIMPAQEVNLVAHWQGNTNTISITNTGSQTSRPSNQNIYINNAPHTNHQVAPVIPVGAAIRIPAGTPPTGHIFGGFAVIGAGGDLVIDNNAAYFIMPNNNVNVEVRWVPAGTPARTVRFYRQIVGSNPIHISSGQYLVGAIVNLNAHWPTAGHVFVEWISAPIDNLASDRTSERTHFTVPSGTGTLTITSTWVVGATPLAAPIVTSRPIAGTTLSWNVPTNAAGVPIRYRIYVDGSSTGRYTSNLTFNLADLGLAPGFYNIQVRAISENQTLRSNSELSSFLQFNVTPPVTPDAIRPTGLSIVNTTLRWNPVMNASRYYIYVNNSRRATIQATTTTTFNPANPSFDLATLADPSLSLGGAGYDIQVRAVVGTVTSHLSEVRRFYAAVPPLPTPTNIRIIGNPTLHWDFPSGHANLVGFRIYVNGQASHHMVGPDARSFPISNLGLTSGVYLIGVRAVGNGIANSDSYISTFVQYVSSTLPALNTPINLNINNNTLTWNAVPNAVGYRIYVNGQASTAGIVGGLSFNLTTLGLGAGTHLIQVRAIANNTTHVDSAISAFVTYVIGGTAGQHTLRFDVSGGIMPAGVSATQIHPSGTILNALPIPTRQGHSFSGWFIGNQLITAPLTINSDINLRAVWSPTTGGAGARAEQFVVTFNPAGGTFPAGEDGLRMGAAGFVINSFTNTPTRAGYTFGGWQVGGTPVSLPLTVNGDMTLNAIWNRIASPTPAPPGTRPNPQTGAFGILNIAGLIVLTGVSVIVFKKIYKKGDSAAR